MLPSFPEEPDDTFEGINGINGDTGDYLLPAISLSELARAAKGEPLDPETLDALKTKSDPATANFPVSGNPLVLNDVGWGVIFAFDDPQAEAIREALKPLLNLRRSQAPNPPPAEPGRGIAQNRGHYREFIGRDAYRPNETKNAFLKRFKIGPGTVQPEQIPYYLLIVGSPEQIPYRFQCELDVQFAVGRIHFDTLQEYENYAKTVVAAETSGRIPERKATLFGVRTRADRATELSADYLIRPLAEELNAANTADGLKKPWQIETLLAEQATRANLAARLGGDQTPSLIMTASHGMGFSKGNTLQLRHQGALLCQDWPGPLGHRGPIPENFYFAGDHLNPDKGLNGLMAFFFACYGAGTPLLDEFAHSTNTRLEVADKPFIAGLPRKMLSHPKGGALAVVGHVERAWGYSFLWGQAAQIGVFRGAMEKLMQGGPIGWVMEEFNLRYAEMATMLSNELEEMKYGSVPDRTLAELWTANADARNYVIIGDPAARLNFSDIVVDTSIGTSSDMFNIFGSTVSANPTGALIPPAPTSPFPGGSAPFEARAESPTEPPTPDEPATSPETTDVSFGLFGRKSEGGDEVEGSLQSSLSEFGNKLAHAFEDLTSLEVQTFTSTNLPGVAYDPETRSLSGPVKLRAITRVSLDGDTLVCLPEDEHGVVDREIWELHETMVTRAQEHRARMIQTAADALASLFRAIRGG